MTRIASTSLQSKLIKTTLLSTVIAGIIAFILLVFFTSYHTMSVQDEIMDEISDMLLLSDVDVPSGQQLDELSDEFDVQYALFWQNSLLIESSGANNIVENIQHKPNFSFVWHDGKLWRIYKQQKTQANLTAIVSQPVSARFDEIWQGLVGYLFILIILWFIQWGLMTWGIKRHLHGLRSLSSSIATKSSEDLAPIQNVQIFSEILPVIDALNQLMLRLNRALQAEQAFTADASHELRSPLSAIKMRLQLIQRKYGNVPELENDLLRIQHDVDRSTQVIENLLLLARLDPTQEKSLNKSALDLNNIVLDVIDTLNLLAQKRQIKLLTNFKINYAPIYGNHDLIFTSIRNLIDNAIRYAKTPSNILIELSKPSEQIVQLKIINSGEHIDQKTLQRLGQRFFRGLGTGEQGTGLGLSITKKIIHLHQADIEFQSPEQGGLIVILKFHALPVGIK